MATGREATGDSKRWKARVVKWLGVLVVATLGVRACTRASAPECATEGKSAAACYRDHAVARSAPELCDEIVDIDGQEHCLSDVAESSSKPRWCGKIASPSLADSCFAHVADDLEEPALCDNVSDPEVKGHCVARVAKSARRPDFCERIETEGKRSDCLRDAMRRGSELSLCDSLRTPKWHQSCLMGMANRELPLCLSQSDQRRAACLPNYFGEVDDAVAGCDSSADCLRAFAKRGDVRICAHLPSSEDSVKWAECIKHALALDTAWVPDSRCDEFKEPQWRERCLVAIGSAGFHDATCAKISDPSLRDRCERGGPISELRYARMRP